MRDVLRQSRISKSSSSDMMDAIRAGCAEAKLSAILQADAPEDAIRAGCAEAKQVPQIVFFGRLDAIVRDVPK